MQLKHLDQPFMELELCNIVLQAILYLFVCVYWVNKGTEHFPVNLKVMTEDFTLLKPKFKITQGVVEKIQGGICTNCPKVPLRSRGSGKCKAKPNPQNNK
mmetsp:Transcript_3324/g.6162  ORF Transcript_3324/g.6162 Transcript_3324/m.6162 type:complete len:100 (-) Transcript_3324:107-406(-)